MSNDERLIELVGAEGADDGSEVTVYVKGFLGRQERADDFEAWTARHRSLVGRRGWAAPAYGWSWESGSMAGIPLPVFSTLKLGWDVYRVVRGAGRSTLLGASALLVGEQAARIAIQFVRQYVSAASAAHQHAEQLAERLDSLRRRYARVRLVAHSLGCVQVLEAAATMTPSDRPHEIHLCAPACLERDVSERLPDLAREQSTLYFTPKDLVLEGAFRLMARGRALGSAGPSRDYSGLLAIDVSDRFEFFVHTEYKNRLDALVPGTGPQDS